MARPYYKKTPGTKEIVLCKYLGPDSPPKPNKKKDGIILNTLWFGDTSKPQGYDLTPDKIMDADGHEKRINNTKVTSCYHLLEVDRYYLIFANYYRDDRFVFEHAFVGTYQNLRGAYDELHKLGLASKERRAKPNEHYIPEITGVPLNDIVDIIHKYNLTMVTQEMLDREEQQRQSVKMTHKIIDQLFTFE